MMFALRSIAASTLLIASLGACGDDGGDDGGDGGDAATENAASGDNADSTAGGSGTPGANCLSRCATVAEDCGAPADVAAGACAGICGMNPTEEELSCLEGSDCSDLTLLIAGDPVCGIGGGGNTTNTTNGSGPATTTTGSSDTATPGGMLGDPCDCGDPTGSCEGTENGCQFSFSGDSYICLVNSADVSTGVCTQTCDPDNDECAEGSCGPETDYLLGETFYVCG